MSSSPNKKTSLVMLSTICMLLTITHCVYGKCPTQAAVDHLQATVAKMKRQLNEHSQRFEETCSSIDDLRTEMYELTSPPLIGSPTAVSSGMPKSCADLQRMGHIWSGFYSVMGDKQMESVFCDFAKVPSEPKFQTRIGSVDVKSSPVYFYVQKSKSFPTKNVPIPFEVMRLNVGGAMDLATGIFTAPKPGTYFFSFSGIGNTGSWMQVGLYINGNLIGKGFENTDYDTFSMQSTLRLNAGDKISLQIPAGNGQVHDDANHFTHFNGWLLQEDLTYQ